MKNMILITQKTDYHEAIKLRENTTNWLKLCIVTLNYRKIPAENNQSNLVFN